MATQLLQKINIRDLLRYSKNKEVRPLHIILANRAQEKLGEIDNVFDVTFHPQLAAADELAFTVYKEANNKVCRLWNDIIQFRLIWVKEYKQWFQIEFSIDDSEKVEKKIITATPLCEAELSQICTDEAEINTEDDIARDDYGITTFYNPNATDCSLLHRVLKKVPNYTIKHVDDTLWNIQRAFSIDDSSDIYDWLTGTLATEVGCLFLFDSNERGIYVYDLETTCLDCGYRDDTDFEVCPKCGGTTLNKPYGFDTTIFVDKKNLGRDIKLEVNTSEIKNCFYVTGGDDTINAAIKNTNPNGTNEYWYFNEDMLNDMPDGLVEKLNSYSSLLDEYNSTKSYTISQGIVNQYNSVINKINSIYTTDPKNELNVSYIGFSNLITALYDTDDLVLYLQSGMMPTWTESEKTAESQLQLLLTNLKTVSVTDVSNLSSATADSAVTLMARAIIDTSMYKFEIVSSTLNSGQKWQGSVKLISYSDDEDTATSETFTVQIDDDYENFINQRIEKAAAKIDTQGVKDLFQIEELSEFKNEIKKYCLSSLNSFQNAYQSAIDVLTEQGVSSEGDILYNDLYLPYYNKLKAIESEIAVRNSDIDIAEVTESTIQTMVNKVHDTLDFKTYLGDYWNIYLSYRREDKYSNDNYISTGLSNEEIIEKANDLIETAKNELIKSCEKQYSITATLNNLLLIKDEEGNCVFEPILDDFTLGNYIRCKIDGKIYKMRIADVVIDYSDLSTLSITFYDVTTINSIVKQAKSLLDTVKSIGTSYSYTQKQAKQGEQANYSLDKIRQEGLNSAQYNIFNTNATITIDEHGLLGRNHDDVTNQYSDEQLRLNGCNIILTDNAFKSTRLAIGKQKYTLNNVLYEEFGVNSDFVISGRIIGGDIYSSNWTTNSKGEITNGTHLNLTTGAFELAGGRIAYDGKNDMTMKGITIKWGSTDDDVNPPEISDINNLPSELESLEDYIDQVDGRIQTYNQTTDPRNNRKPTYLEDWGDDSDHIGDLWVNPSTGITKRWNGSSWVEVTDTYLESLAKSKAQIFTVKPTVAYFKGDMIVPAEDFTVDNVTYLHEKAYRAVRDSSVDSNGNYQFSNNDWDALDYTNDDTITNFISGDYAETISKIGTQIDGKARAWYQSTDPSKSWDTNEDHDGDLWYDTTSTSQNTYIYDGTNQKWLQTNVPKAVFDEIDGKRQIFVKKPSSAYMTGDLWVISKSDCTYNSSTAKYCITVNGTTYEDNTTLVAVLPSGTTERTSYVESDWVDISTHDGIIALDQSTQALGLLDDIASDSKITPSEKQQIKLLMDNITSEKVQILNQCAQYDMSNTSSSYYSHWKNYSDKYNSLNTCVSSILNDMNTTIDVPSNFTLSFSAYYAAKETIITDIEKATKEYTDEVRVIADTAKSISENAKDIGDTLVKGLGFQETEISDSYIISPVIAGGSVLIGDKDGTYAQITTDGVLNAKGANISGKIISISGNIGGCEIDDGHIFFNSPLQPDGNYYGFGLNGNMGNYDNYGAIAFYAGHFGKEQGVPSANMATAPIRLYHNGLAILQNAIISGTIYATDGEFTGKIISTSGNIGGCEISDGRIYYDSPLQSNGRYYGFGLFGSLDYPDDEGNSVAFYAGRFEESQGVPSENYKNADIRLYHNGSAVLNNAVIKGAIYAQTGEIGNWIISKEDTTPGALISKTSGGNYSYLNSDAIMVQSKGGTEGCSMSANGDFNCSVMHAGQIYVGDSTLEDWIRTNILS